MACVRHIDIAAPLDQVWGAWTTKAATERWLAPGANVDFAEGGAYEFFWDEDPKRDSTLGCKLLSIQPQRLLRFSWQGKTEFLPMFRDPYGPTEVEVRFSPSDGGTHVTVEQAETRDLPDWPAYDAWMAGTWEYALGQLKAHCEGGPAGEEASCC